MSINPFERDPTRSDDTKEKESYHRYLELGGIINEPDYKSALERARVTNAVDKTRLAQAEGIAKFAGIELHNTEDTTDPRIILYGILRSDVRHKGVERHHDEMSDQRIFAEVLRMLDDIESLGKLTEVYPNIFSGHDKAKEIEKEYKKAA